MNILAKLIAMAALTAIAGVASAACPDHVLKATLQRFNGASIVDCQLHTAVTPSALPSSSEQVVALLDTSEGVTIAVFATTKNKVGRTTLASMPIFVFSELGESAIDFKGDGRTDTKLMVRDLDGDGLKEIAAVGVSQPSASLWLKSYDRQKKRFQDVTFREAGPANAAGPLILSTGHVLKVPASMREPFVVSTADGKLVASYLFAAKVD